MVIAGHATFTLDGVELDAPNGTLVFVRDPRCADTPSQWRRARRVLAIGGLPGVHTPSAWEWYFEAERHRESADYDAALELLAGGTERFPDSAPPHSTACWEAMAGNTDAAIAALTARVRADPRCLERSQGDADLDAIRGCRARLSDAADAPRRRA